MKNHLIANKSKYLLGALLVFSFAVRVWYSFRDNSIWWDEAVYIGMGKYLATGGLVGFWEFFRPPLLPVFYAWLYKLHLPLIFFGKSLVVLSSLALIYWAYVLAEKIKEGAGLWAGVFLSITPVFFYYSKIPLSDLVSVLAASFALYLFINKKDFFSGILAGIAFLLRFPEGLILAPILISLLSREQGEGEFYLKRVFYSGLRVMSGFLVLAVPYLISNYLFYGNMLEPLRVANSMMSKDLLLYAKGTWYYVKELWAQAPFLFLSLISLFAVAVQFKKNSTRNLPLVSVFATAAVFCLYFFLQPHKELRYSLAFIPHLAVLSGAGLAAWLEKMSAKKLLQIIFIAGIIFFLYRAEPFVGYLEADPYRDLYSYFANKSGAYISTTPVPVAASEILITQLFYDAPYGFNDVLNSRFNQINGVIVDSCAVSCASGGSCEKEINNLYKKLAENFKQTYSRMDGACAVSVFEKIK